MKDKTSRKVSLLCDTKYLGDNFRQNDKISRKVFLLSDTKYLGDNFRGRIKSHADISFKGYAVFMGNLEGG